MMDHPFLLLVVTLVMICADVTSSVTCDFEVGMCGWYSEASQGYIFHRHSGPTADRSSGPENDHTLPDSATGHYLYTTGWEAQGLEDIATLLSPPLTLPHPATLSLWYQMNGHGVGSLSLLIYQLSGRGEGGGGGGGRSRGSLLWTIEGRQGLRWKQKQTFIPSGRWQLEIRTSAKHPYGADIAVDDVLLHQLPEVNSTTPRTLTHQHTQQAASTTRSGTSPLISVISNNVTTTSAGLPGWIWGQKTTEEKAVTHTSSGFSHAVTRTPVGGSGGSGSQVRDAVIGVCVGLMSLAGALTAAYLYKRVRKNKVRHFDKEQPEQKQPECAAPSTVDVRVE